MNLIYFIINVAQIIFMHNPVEESMVVLNTQTAYPGANSCCPVRETAGLRP